MTNDKPETIAVITRQIVQRSWNEIEPKLFIGLAGGGIAAFVTSFLESQFHVKVSELQHDIIVIGLFLIAGYLTPSGGVTVTTPVRNAVGDVISQIEKHSGQSTVSISTSSIPVQSPAPKPAQAPNIPLSELVKGASPTAAQQGNPEDDKATQVLPPAQSIDGH